MDLRDFFGHDVATPDAPDFWRLSEVVLGLDANIEEARDPEHEKRLGEELAQHIDVASATHVAMQKALKVLKLQAGEITPESFPLLAGLTTLYLEGLIAGIRFRERGGHREA